MSLLKLALKSIKFRKTTLFLTLLSISLSVLLLLGVEKVKRAAEEGFTQTISQTDLIVGARSGPVQLILYTVFNMGNATHNISWQTYQDLKKHPAIEWTIPYSLGDGHRGFRVVATNEDFFKHYHFRGDQSVQLSEGKVFDGMWDVVIGSDVAKDLKYKLDQKVVIAHGVTKGEGILNHDDKPFHVVGIMKPTGTPLDRAVYISLEGMEALHIDWKDGSPDYNHRTDPATLKKEDIPIKTITAFFLRTKSRIETLRLQREINEYKEEPLLAIIPGVVLSELWQSLSYVEKILKFISWMVLAVGVSAMLIALLTSLNERRREMAILRSLGVKGSQIVVLFVAEALVVVTAGIAVGVALSWFLQLVLGPWIESNFGFYLQGPFLTSAEIIDLAIVFIIALIASLWPAIKAMNQALKDGLTIKI